MSSLWVLIRISPTVTVDPSAIDEFSRYDIAYLLANIAYFHPGALKYLTIDSCISPASPSLQFGP
ncbi:hypothetical protein [Peribacillus frigoritolerans]|uniref:hypothetical protein n=1 Tax=Peribacillus frigoritolerans TaxID=450367 RepID=UPI0032E406C5